MKVTELINNINKKLKSLESREMTKEDYYNSIRNVVVEEQKNLLYCEGTNIIFVDCIGDRDNIIARLYEEVEPVRFSNNKLYNINKVYYEVYEQVADKEIKEAIKYTHIKDKLIESYMVEGEICRYRMLIEEFEERKNEIMETLKKDFKYNLNKPIEFNIHKSYENMTKY